MNLSRFVDAHRGNWRRLERLLDDAGHAGLATMPAQDVRDLARLYRSASADLLRARATPGAEHVVDYLEAVVGRAYVFIHAPAPLRWAGWRRFALRGFPAAARKGRRFLLAALGVFALGFLLAFVLVLADEQAFEHLVDPSVSAFYGERPENYRSERFGLMSSADAAAFSAQLMVNNIRVTILAFALGLTFGVGTVAVLFQNGVLLGAIAANFVRWGLSVPFWALILPHGVAEMFAMLLGGAGGLMLAEAMVRPGRMRRTEALRQRGREALAVAGMALPLLVFAGVVEAYVTPLQWVPDGGKLAFAALSALALGLWLRVPEGAQPGTTEIVTR